MNQSEIHPESSVGHLALPFYCVIIALEPAGQWDGRPANQSLQNGQVFAAQRIGWGLFGWLALGCTRKGMFGILVDNSSIG